MANHRFIFDNAVERATLVASSTAGALVVTNLQKYDTSEVWRATGTTATISGTVSTAETASGLGLWGNFSPTTTVRVRFYSDEAGANQVLDTGAVRACPAPALKLRGWTPAKAASAYAYGAGAIADVWFPLTTWRKFVIEVVDTDNLQGYVEVAQAFLGPYWSPADNASAVSATDVDATTHYRTDAGGLKSRASTIHKKVSIDFSYIPGEDRSTLADGLRGSRAYPIFATLFPGHSDPKIEQAHKIMGCRTSDSEIAIQMAIFYGAKMEIESI